MNLTNVKHAPNCAFCKHWYDPINAYIGPKAPNIGLWEYDMKAECKCLIRNINTKEYVGCRKFEGKV